MDGHPYTFTEVADAVQAAREAHAAGRPVVWSGPDHLHYSVGATSPEPSWQLSEERLAYHLDQDRSFEDVLTMVIFHLGYSSAATAREAPVDLMTAECKHCSKPLQRHGTQGWVAPGPDWMFACSAREYGSHQPRT